VVWGGSGISWTIANNHSRQITTPTSHHSIFTGQMVFLTPNQQCQSIEGTNKLHHYIAVTLAMSQCCCELVKLADLYNGGDPMTQNHDSIKLTPAISDIWPFTLTQHETSK